MRDIHPFLSKSQWLRKEIFDMVIRTQKGHIPSCYSCSEIVLALCYGGMIRFDAKNPRSKNRDSLIVSKGHAAMVLYPILADLGFYPKEELLKFTNPNGILRMYADHTIPGIEAICGSLGHGFTIAAGYALAAKRDGRDSKSYVIVSDGECYEGSVWETAMFASHYELDNLITVVDRNGLCILSETEKCVKLNPLEDKWKAFGWNVINVNGHSYTDIFRGFDDLVKNKNKKPTVIISKSVKGKGISFMENKVEWHNKMPNAEQVGKARENLEKNCIIN
ncbi:MAG: hypothetical protein A3I11_02055 [Elusimicrobia bacterium RIFCSPLOWO2_02_FULL_39_32]|nr:MAG: hypothetical protein A3B80_06940 [Elusimicrobia bacterium RIFCSPHIGHO2_02_FULL_39_36]OGR92162.1 MAG: hypothetical protein A3I11_02055 [Elusimicrobia bacterium RIFCSPLOWO2_02_FULL_39_32]OGR99970.1 MAG: hypothetical protein A3G85_03380 [Elusimicrobia bacterium RIFCSPLOWO2_12_FULL_39_28]